MSLYGLDIITDKKGEHHLIEINGANTGMAGFEIIYGDNRVERTVYETLSRGHNALTVNLGAYASEQHFKKHPIRGMFLLMISQTSMAKELVRYLRPRRPRFLKSSKAHTEWLDEREEVFGSSDDIDDEDFGLPVYRGQESLVLNWNNDELPHPTVNPYVAEEIARNKFLQYLVLKDTEIGDCIPPSVLVGLGATDEKKLEEILALSDFFALKPLLSARGVGVRRISKQEAEQYIGTRGPIEDTPTLLQRLSALAGSLTYIDDLVHHDNFMFELGVLLLQPFVETARIEDKPDMYTSIRAIVCNGKFVDAYMRASPEPRVNLAMDAEALPINSDGLGEFCEHVAEVFEREYAKYNPKTFKRELYEKYLDERGRTDEAQRQFDSLRPLVGGVVSVFAEM